MSPNEFYELTPLELTLYIKRHGKNQINKENELIRQAYYIANLVWAEKLPDIETLMVKPTESSEKKTEKLNTEKELFEIAKSKGLRFPRKFN